METIKPNRCPICQRDDILVCEYGSDDMKTNRIECRYCGCGMMFPAPVLSMSELIECWNEKSNEIFNAERRKIRTKNSIVFANDGSRLCVCPECSQAMKENERMKKNIDRLHDQIMNLSCVVAPSMNINDRLSYKFGHRDARHAAAELVAGIKAK